jgi:hypothetical protein
MKFRVNAFAWTVAVSTLVLAAACAPSADLPDTPELRLEKAGVLARMERAGGAYDETLDLGASLERFIQRIDEELSRKFPELAGEES